MKIQKKEKLIVVIVFEIDFFFFWLNNRCRLRPAPVPLVELAFSDLWITPHSRIVSPTYSGTVHLGLEPMTGMLLSRTS